MQWDLARLPYGVGHVAWRNVRSWRQSWFWAAVRRSRDCVLLPARSVLCPGSGRLIQPLPPILNRNSLCVRALCWLCSAHCSV